MHLINNNQIYVYEEPNTMAECIEQVAQSCTEPDPFFAVDLQDICNKHINWLRRMPRVTPHYAVKCNDDIYVIKVLAFIGASFDCASKGEIKKVMDLGVSADRIIYANPCKQASYIRYAKEMGVNMMTFDNENELIKIHQNHSGAKLVLRIVTDDSNAVCRFSMKFGADLNTARQLLEKAQELNLNVIGVSFHCGSGQMTTTAFVDAIQNARLIMNYGLKLGFNMYLLDIGGGFPGNSGTEKRFNDIADAVNRTLDEFFPDDEDFHIIAEPGRYYVASAYTLATNVIAIREMLDPNTGKSNFMYYINDGVYGSFNCVLYDHYVPEPSLMTKNETNETFTSSIWGPTCDGLDCIHKSIELAKMKEGDWLIWKDMGAYTISAATEFNGLPFGKPAYFMSRMFWETIREIFEPNERKPLFEHRRIRYKSNDCCFEAEEDQPWNIDELFEEASAVAIQ